MERQINEYKLQVTEKEKEMREREGEHNDKLSAQVKEF